MTATIYKFPFSVSRRAYARKARASSKNGTPEERAAKAVLSKKSEVRTQRSNPLRAKIVTVSRAATIAGMVNYHSRDLSRIGPLGERHSRELRSAAKEARYLASDFERAAEQLEEKADKAQAPGADGAVQS
jgi:phage gp16-like protein